MRKSLWQILLIVAAVILFSAVDAEAAQMVLRTVGTVVGSYFGGPIGGMVGGMIGGMLGGFLFPEKPQQMGPRIKDRDVVSAAFGSDVMDSWGCWACEGLLIDASDLKETEHVVGGKGGMISASPAGIFFTYSVDALWLLRRRQADAVLDFWFDTKKVRDISPEATLAEVIASNSKVKGGGRLIFYMGGEDQLPDPTLEALHGVGDVPAHRGVVTAMAKNLQLANYSNRVPEATGEVCDIANGGFKDFGELFAQNVDSAFAVRQTWDHVDNNGEVVSVVADSNELAMAFAEYMDPTHPKAYFWQRFTPEGVFREDKMIPDPLSPLNLEIPFPAVGQADEPASVLVGNAGYYLMRFKENTIALMSSDPAWFIPELRRWVLHDNVFSAYMGVAYGDPHKNFAEWGGNGGNLIRQSTFLNAYSVVDYTATKKFYYFLDSPNSAVHSRILKVDREHWIVRDTLEMPVAGMQTIFAEDDDEIYATKQIGNEGPVTFYKVTGGSDKNNNGWGENDKRAEIINLGTGAIFFTIGFGAHLLVRDGIFYYGQANGGMHRFAMVAAGDGIPLSKFVGDACRIAGLPETRFDVSELTDTLWGYARDKQMSMVDLIRPTMPHFFFDGVESGPLIKWPKRGRSVSFTIPLSDLGAFEAGQQMPDLMEHNQVNERKLPMLLKVRYKQRDKDYEMGMQTDQRILGDYQHVVQFDLPISMTDDEAKRTARRLMAVAWTERNSAKISLDRRYIEMEPADVLEITQ